MKCSFDLGTSFRTELAENLFAHHGYYLQVDVQGVHKVL